MMKNLKLSKSTKMSARPKGSATVGRGERKSESRETIEVFAAIQRSTQFTMAAAYEDFLGKPKK
jgi:hypothetical protein